METPCKCRYCKFGEYPILYYDNFYTYCLKFEEWVEQCIADDENLGCDGFEHDDRFDDTTESA